MINLTASSVFKKDFIYYQIIDIFFFFFVKIPLDFIQDVMDNYKNLPFHNIVHAYEVFKNEAPKTSSKKSKEDPLTELCDHLSKASY